MPDIRLRKERTSKKVLMCNYSVPNFWGLHVEVSDGNKLLEEEALV